MSLQPITEQITKQIRSLQLFKSLTKDGCEWQGDVWSRRWSECLYVPDAKLEAVRRTLEQYEEGVDYKWDGLAVWIA